MYIFIREWCIFKGELLCIFKVQLGTEKFSKKNILKFRTKNFQLSSLEQRKDQMKRTIGPPMIKLPEG